MFEYHPTGSGAYEATLLRHHLLRAMYSSAAANLFGTTADYPVRVKRKTWVLNSTVTCAATPLRAGSPVVCSASLQDYDISPVGPPTGQLSWTVAQPPSPGGGTFGPPCNITALVPACGVSVTPAQSGNYSFRISYTPDVGDLYHSPGGLRDGPIPLLVGDATTTSVPVCVPNTVLANTNATCSFDVTNTTGFTAPLGGVTLSFTPNNIVANPLCTTAGNITHCTLTYNAPTPVGPVTATVSFHDPSGSYGDSDSGPAVPVLQVT